MNCIVKKLDAIVNHNELPYFNTLVFNVSGEITKGISDKLILEANEGENITVEIVGDGFFRTSSSDDTSIGKVVNLTGGGTVFPSNGTYKIIVSPIYTLKTFDENFITGKMSSSFKLISAGLPAPSITIISFSSANPLNASIISGMSFFF